MWPPSADDVLPKIIDVDLPTNDIDQEIFVNFLRRGFLVSIWYHVSVHVNHHWSCKFLLSGATWSWMLQVDQATSVWRCKDLPTVFAISIKHTRRNCQPVFCEKALAKKVTAVTRQREKSIAILGLTLWTCKQSWPTIRMISLFGHTIL